MAVVVTGQYRWAEECNGQTMASSDPRYGMTKIHECGLKGDGRRGLRLCFESVCVCVCGEGLFIYIAYACSVLRAGVMRREVSGQPPSPLL